ncbi:MAG TPA: hypothetical protein DIT64_14645 [Verrucomicrobiales bacterium]|nr:hypothetical protein [Verrucomicrobiales bacterium]
MKMPDTTATSVVCPVCGAALAAGEAGGLCVACLLGEALGTEQPAKVLGSIGGHDLIEVIARGGMGIVYRAQQRDPRREVALKALSGAELMSAEAKQRFKIEAEAMARLDHPSILPIYELGEEDGTPFFTMKLAAGGTLSQRIGGYAGKWREIVELMARIAEAVHYARSRGVLHRDLKPGNILFDEEGHAMVSDFGLAKMIGSDNDLTKTLAMMGTPNYMAPELVRKNGGASTASDVWSLGVILYELLAGRVPFTGDNVPAVLRAVVEDEPAGLAARRAEAGNDGRLTATPYSERIPRDLAVITFKALQKEPSRRYHAAEEFAGDLRRWLAGEPIHARPVALAERVWLWAKRKPALAAALALLALTLLGSTFLLLHSNENLRAVDAQRRAQIHRALLEKADAERQSMTPGRRGRTLALVREALAHGPSVQARSVAASALAVMDVKVEREWPVGRVGFGQSPMAFTPDLSQHIAILPAAEVRDRAWKQGALGLRRTSDGVLLKQIPLTNRAYYSYASLSQDARWLVTSTRRSKLEIWHLEKETLHTTLTSTTQPAAAFLPSDGTLIAALDGALVRLRLPDLRREVITTGISAVGRLFPSPDAQYLAVYCFDETGKIEGGWIEVRSLADGRVLARQDQPYGDAGWSNDGQSVVMFHYPTGYLLRHSLDDASSQPLALLRTTGTGRRAVFRSGDRLLGWSDNENFVHLHDLWLGQPSLVIPGTAMNLKFSADGTRLAWNPDSESAAIAKVLDSPILTQRRASGHERSVDRHLAVSPDGRWIATGDLFGLTLWRTEGMRPVAWRLTQKPRDPFENLHFSRDSRQLRFYCGTSKHVTWDIVESADGVVTLTGPGPGDVPSRHYLQAASPDGRWQITFRADEKNVFAHLWEDGKFISKRQRDLEPGLTSRRNCLVSPDGRWWAAGAWNRDRSRLPGFIYVQSTEVDDSRILLSEAACHTYLAVSPDGRWLLGGEGENYAIWESGTWKKVFTLPAGLSDAVPGTAAFSADGRLLALEVDHGKIRLLHVGTWDEVLTLTPPQDLPLVRMAFSPDGRHLYTTGGQILHRWDVARLREELEGMGLGW